MKIKVIYYINRTEDKNMIVSIDAETTFEKNSFFQDKNSTN